MCVIVVVLKATVFMVNTLDFQMIFRIGRITKYVVVTQAKKRVCRNHDALASKKATWYVLILFFNVPNEQKKYGKKYDRI